MFLTTWFQSSPPSATEKVAKLRLHLRHRSLQELEQRNIVEYDGDDDLVKEGLRFREKWEDFQE
ncbi:hypothetical protein CK500_14310 [Halorubrum salipaludis]|uniref:Uncharacterized protein n=1 Tax=Halorubrum salipaludis TaxID=2032630 RepID=A0A2A2FA61_9EURY|nr:hypothetical protein CK500_14310 [Halorubrum salipaludis]